MESPVAGGGTGQGQTLQIPEGAQAAILIVLTADQQISVAGSIDSKVVALGLLESAKFAVVKHIEDVAKGRQIIAPSPGLAHVLSMHGKNGRG